MPSLRSLAVAVLLFAALPALAEEAGPPQGSSELLQRFQITISAKDKCAHARKLIRFSLTAGWKDEKTFAFRKRVNLVRQTRGCADLQLTHANRRQDRAVNKVSA